MIAANWSDPVPEQPGPERDAWLKLRGWESYEQWERRGSVYPEYDHEQEQEPST